MKKYIFGYDTGSGMELKFFQTDKNLKELGLQIGVYMWGIVVDDDLKEVLHNLFGIDFEDGETVLIEEIPEEFETI